MCVCDVLSACGVCSEGGVCGVCVVCVWCVCGVCVVCAVVSGVCGVCGVWGVGCVWCVICKNMKAPVYNVLCCQAVIRNLVYRSMCMLQASNNSLVMSIQSSRLVYTSRIRKHWRRLFCM